MKKLIARVHISVWTKGEKQTIPPGDPVPELSPHDEAELIRMGAVEDWAETEEAIKETVSAAAQAKKDYLDARKAVQAAQESIQVEPVAEQETPEAEPPVPGEPVAEQEPEPSNEVPLVPAPKTTKASSKVKK